jgi:hypothetical protein
LFLLFPLHVDRLVTGEPVTSGIANPRRAAERSHLELRKLDFALHVGVGRVDVIADVVTLIDARSTDPILHVVLQFRLTFDEHLFQV